ncbi:response regulator [Phormidium sp. LEGE 05292]|uniref:hybrid sensor histidine kinase/response regulator n=1 Tax=[Phormidium] sp. LEGE 05292 TaxID=767427 RepID=UPI00188065FF|nr:response regulator [Phormidium sp. LEGE 05292]MBE9228276.1 response regulator [Phormidium sp. LEGE 05292]
MNILLIEDNLAEARLLQEVLKGAIISRFNLAHVKRLGDAIASLKTESFDVVLLDLTLPDSEGLASLDSLIQHAPSLPVVVLTNTNDDELALESVRHGAQDYLVKRHINQDILVRSLRYAIERKQAAEALREANEILEHRVQERTAALAMANELLRQEIEWRQRIQSRLELAQQAGKIVSFEWIIQTNDIIWTAELEALYGLAPGSFDGQYEGWMQSIHPDDRPKVEQELWQAVKKGQGLDTEFRIVCPPEGRRQKAEGRREGQSLLLDEASSPLTASCRVAGEIRWIAVKSSLFCDQTGQAVRMIGIQMDITEKKQLEAQFLRAQRLESLGTLASGIAHDLNNILTPILAVVQLLPLKLPNLNDNTQQLLKTLESSAQRGADLIKQILSFARGVEGKRINLQIHHLLFEIQQIIQQTLPKSIDIHSNIPANLWTIYGDTTQLHQVFMNLCVNARDAMPNGGNLQIIAQNFLVDEQYARMHLDAKVGAYVVVNVSDTGMGIPPEILHRVFDPFFTTKEVGKGTGLGLSAVLGIVKSHGGFIDVQSEVNKGSVFKVYLPAIESLTHETDDNLELLTGQQELILIVDDEVAITEIIKTTLETYNYRVLTASDGIEAIALYAEYKNEIAGVLMDIMMPTMDGTNIIPLLRRLNPNVYVVAMSGLNSTEVVSQVQKLGFQGFLSKPFTTKELLWALCKGLGTRD